MPEDTSSESHHANQKSELQSSFAASAGGASSSSPEVAVMPSAPAVGSVVAAGSAAVRASAVVPESVISIASIFDSENLRIDSEPIAQLTICGSVGRSAGLACRFSFGWLHFSASGRRLRRSRRRGWYGLGDRRGRLKAREGGEHVSVGPSVSKSIWVQTQVLIEAAPMAMRP